MINMKIMRLCEKVKMICVKKGGAWTSFKSRNRQFIPLNMTDMVSSLARDTNTVRYAIHQRNIPVSISWYLEIYKTLGVKW